MGKLNMVGNIFNPLKRIERTPNLNGDPTKIRLCIHVCKCGAASAIAKKAKKVRTSARRTTKNSRKHEMCGEKRF